MTALNNGSGGGDLASIDPDLDRLSRRLRLPYLRAAAPDVLVTATAQRWAPAETVRALLVEEERGRDHATTQIRRRKARLPTGKTFDVWDPAISSIAPATQSGLRTLEWIDRHENLVICGPSGTGKSMFLEALGHAAIDNQHTVGPCRRDVPSAVAAVLQTIVATLGRNRSPPARSRCGQAEPLGSLQRAVRRAEMP